MERPMAADSAATSSGWTRAQVSSAETRPSAKPSTEAKSTHGRTEPTRFHARHGGTRTPAPALPRAPRGAARGRARALRPLAMKLAHVGEGRDHPQHPAVLTDDGIGAHVEPGDLAIPAHHRERDVAAGVSGARRDSEGICSAASGTPSLSMSFQRSSTAATPVSCSCESPRILRGSRVRVDDGPRRRARESRHPRLMARRMEAKRNSLTKRT